MTTIMIKDLLDGITTLSKRNQHRFKDIKRKFDTIEGDIIADFSEVDLVSPEKLPDFIDLLKDERVTFKIYEDEELYRKLNFTLLMIGMDVNKKLIHVRDETEVPEIVDEQLMSAMRVVESTYRFEDGVGYVDIAGRLSVLTRNYYFEAIRNVIEGHTSETSHFVIILNGVSLQEFNIKTIADIIVSFDGRGITVEVDDDDEDHMRVLQTNVNLGINVNMSNTKKYEIMREIPEFTAGIFTTYKNGKKDSFNRSGNGERATSLPARYIGCNKSHASFEVYRKKTFCKRVQYQMEEHEQHPGLDYYVAKVPYDELGFGQFFLGSKYHFNLPIQLKKQNVFNVAVHNSENELDYKKMNLPEYMASIFEDFNVQYDKEMMAKSIFITDKNINKM